MTLWPVRSLGELVRQPLTNGRSVPTRVGGFPVLRLTALRTEGVDLQERKGGAWSREEASRYLVAEGDFLVARGSGSLDLVGRGSLVRRMADEVAFPDTAIRVRPAVGQISPEYLSLLWNSPMVRMQVESMARTTAGIYKVNQEHLNSVRLPVPALGEQRRIVDILDDHLSRLGAADSYLEAGLRRLIALRRSSLDRHFGPSEPSVPLSALVNGVQAGRSFGGASAPAALNEWGIIKVSAMTWGEFRAGENKAVAAAGIDPRYEIKHGDLLVSRANTSDYVGASVLVGPVRSKLLLSDKSLRLIPRLGVKAEWLWRALQAPAARRQISAMATGTKDSMRNISQSALLRVALPDARADEQEDAVVRFRALDGSIRRLQEQLRAAQRQREGLRRALLAAAFCGQLTGQVGDDDVMEEVADAQTSARAAE